METAGKMDNHESTIVDGSLVAEDADKKAGAAAIAVEKSDIDELPSEGKESGGGGRR